jgi:hypothetical protein
MAFLQHRFFKGLIVALAMTMCVLSVSVLGPILPLLSVIVFVAGLIAGMTGWIKRIGDAAAVLAIGFFLCQITLAGSVVIFGSGPPRLESCIGYLILICGVTIIFLWFPFCIGLLIGILIDRWMESNIPENKAVEAMAISPSVGSETTPAAASINRKSIQSPSKNI